MEVAGNELSFLVLKFTLKDNKNSNYSLQSTNQ